VDFVFLNGAVASSLSWLAIVGQNTGYGVTDFWGSSHSGISSLPLLVA
jgi:hypothetical protein